MSGVGIIGLGIMGSAYAHNLLAAGIHVAGVDPLPQARDALAKMGGKPHEQSGAWLAECDLVILSLLSPTVMREICGTLAELLSPGQIVLETGTFALADKETARDSLEAKGVHLLDCPVSGTGVQARAADIVMLASGDSGAIDRARPFMDHLTKKVIVAGAFGAGTRLKFIANHAVALHNAAAAETLAYSEALGLDAQVTYELLSSGAGQSKMSDLRMPLMIEAQYDPPTASLKMFQKDLSVIGDDLRRLGLKVPLFDVVDGLYQTANAELPEGFDTASVFEVYRKGKQ